MSLHITSLQNPRVKRLLNLQQKSSARKAENLFVVEGAREVERAMASGYVPKELWLPEGAANHNFAKLFSNVLVTCSEAVFNKISYREGAAEVVAVMPVKSHRLADIQLPANPLIVVVEDVEKPGNLGAILRTCNGLGAHAVVVCNPQTDIHNPNVVRNSLGAFFDIPIAVTDTAAAIAFLNAQNIQIVAAYLPASVAYTSINYTIPTALVFGSEAEGLSAAWVKNTGINAVIPMHGVVDSLNVSVAVAIMLSEALRQRL